MKTRLRHHFPVKQRTPKVDLRHLAANGVTAIELTADHHQEAVERNTKSQGVKADRRHVTSAVMATQSGQVGEDQDLPENAIKKICTQLKRTYFFVLVICLYFYHQAMQLSFLNY
eukprot:m.24125 g.24125  ORF g.24125 m.24125 type:complete len:115 (+) comp28568_c0_seq5:1706-2050(+)